MGVIRAQVTGSGWAPACMAGVLNPVVRVAVSSAIRISLARWLRSLNAGRSTKQSFGIENEDLLLVAWPVLPRMQVMQAMDRNGATQGCGAALAWAVLDGGRR